MRTGLAEPPRNRDPRDTRAEMHSIRGSAGLRRDGSTATHTFTGSPLRGGDVFGSGAAEETYSAPELGGRRTRRPTREQDVPGLRPTSGNRQRNAVASNSIWPITFEKPLLTTTKHFVCSSTPSFVAITSFRDVNCEKYLRDVIIELG